MSENPQNDVQGNTGSATGQQAVTERTFTQQQLDSIVNDRLKGFADYEAIKKELEQRRQAEMSEADKVKARLDQLEKEKAEAVEKAQTETLKTLRLQVALEKGLPSSLAKRLTGATYEELVADADGLLADAKQLATGQKPTPPDLDGAAGAGQRGQPSNLTPEQVALGAKMGVSPDLMQRYKKQ